MKAVVLNEEQKFECKEVTDRNVRPLMFESRYMLQAFAAQIFTKFKVAGGTHYRL
ncbi:hypothetical protein [Enterococcus rivorum]|uniref:hypothetical protein n=1 Tax=Enterococcus rivorum TaxID=762845 RepID=UPI003638B6A1